MPEISPTPAPKPLSAPSRNDTLMNAAQALEANFLSELLKSAGIGETPDTFGGGAGEDQFGSFLRDAQAQQMAQAGGIGLAQSLFDSMVGAQNDDSD